MCGIVGIIDKEKTRDYSMTIHKMLKSISHRGPDEQRLFSDCLSGLYLGFCRLSMVDIDKSIQPLWDSNKETVILFNGEIYNYKALKNELPNYAFKTDGEAELILALYKFRGDDFVSLLDGMFAICIVDLKGHKVILARDQFGIKPLYYYETKSIVAFSSEVKAFSDLLTLEIDPASVEMYLALRFIPAPFTIFRNVKKLKAGEILVFSSRTTTHKQYIHYNRPVNNTRFEKNKLKTVLERSITSTFTHTEVPIGLFLSGGLDSGIIASTIKDYITDGEKLFFIDYPGNQSNADEKQIVRESTREMGIRYKPILFDETILQKIDEVLYSLDEPLFTTVANSTYNLSLIAAQSVKGVLTGDGSDELLFGYNYLRSALKSNNPIESYLEGIGWVKNLNYKEILQQSCLHRDDINQILFSDCEIRDNTTETLRRVELYKRLPDYHLMRMDRMTMAFGLEARLPYLRNEYVEYILGINNDYLLENSDPKALLKQAFSNKLPSALLNSTKKPFFAPVKYWVENTLNEDIVRVFNDDALINALQLNKLAIQAILKNYRGSYADVSNIWGLFVLLKWYGNTLFSQNR